MQCRGATCLMVGMAVSLLAGCFEVPPLPTAPECVADADCQDSMFCNGAETCDDGRCVAGAPCADAECTELGEGRGVCGGAGEPEPGPEPQPGPTPEPFDPEPFDPAPPEPEPVIQCVEGEDCVRPNGAIGRCREGACVAIPCEDASNCPSPGCATCEGRTCGVVENCASVSLSCRGLPGARLRIECGLNPVTLECSLDARALAAGCRPRMPARACCGDVGADCDSVDAVVGNVRLSVTPPSNWACRGAPGSASCQIPQLLRGSHTSVNCEVELFKRSGER